jgi:hypothetical protein
MLPAGRGSLVVPAGFAVAEGSRKGRFVLQRGAVSVGVADIVQRAGLPTATNMIATDWRQMRHAIQQHSKVLGDTDERSGIGTTFAAAAAKADSASIAALYSLDAQVMPAGNEPIRGREAIERFWRGALDSGIAAVRLFRDMFSINLPPPRG